MEYLLKASALLTIFYGCYILFLQRETFFDSNRWFLVLGLLTSVLFPLFVIPIYVDMPASSNDSFNIVAASIQNTPESVDLSSLFIWIYATVGSFFLVRLIIQLFSLNVLIKKHDKKKIDSYIFIETQQNTTPFSFFKWIIYNPEHFNQQELQLILQHEKVHAKQMHSMDVLLIDIASALFWFNPFIWLYRKALMQNLEFIADDNTQKTTNCEERYQKLLLKTSLPQENLIFINTFYNSTIKKRIVMLHKSKSKLMNTWKYSIMVPLLIVFALTFNTETIAQTPDQVSESASNDQQNVLKFVVTKDTKDSRLDVIKNKLTDEGANITFKNLKRNSKDELTDIKIKFRYKGVNKTYYSKLDQPISPIEISINPSKGTINLGQQSSELSQTFDVDTMEDGQIKINKTSSKNTALITKDEEAEIIYEEENNIKIIELNSDDNSEETEIIDEQPISILLNSKKKRLIIIDGKEITKEQMEAIDPNDIGFISILKDKKVTKKYGQKGENGVILITTKKEKLPSNDENPPLYILGDKEITKEQMEAINPNTIDAVNVLKDAKATEKYGKKGKNGVIIITLKKE
jgi:bla regulator protein BlaR1